MSDPMDSAPPLLSVHRKSLSGGSAQELFPPPPPPPPPADEAPAAPSLPASPAVAPAPAPVTAAHMEDVLLTVNPPRLSDSFEEPADDPAERAITMEMVRRETHASTAARRLSAMQLQNEASWRRMQKEMAAMPEDGEEVEDPSSSPETARPMLRPSAAQQQQQQQQTKRGSLARPGLLGASSSGGADSSITHETASAGEWEASGAAAQSRAASPSHSFLSANEQSMMLQLPREFTGSAKLVMPNYLTGPISNVTLPSRLDLLGRRGFRVLGALFPRRVGNSVLGWAPVLTTSWSSKEWKVKMQLFHLPWLFSKSMARIFLFLRFVFVALVVIFILDLSGVETARPGRVWVIGVVLALAVMAQQSRYRRAPDGVMAFCRSMGVPDVEEIMFSYCWKVEPDNVRTLAKAVWKSGVGVWIDVVKLCPGDEIRPMVRTTVRRVHKVVVFLCDEYCQSPNCCIEMMEAVQHPEKVTICIIKDNINPKIMRFLLDLKPRGLRMCVGFDELMQTLDGDLQDMTDISAFHWWRSQAISGAGVPDNLVPSGWPMARFSLTGKLILPEKSVDVGPLYISGDCKGHGQSLAPPWLLFVALVAVGINIWDMYDKYMHNSFLHSNIDYIFLGVIAGLNCAPFIGFQYLLDRRRDAHVALRPLLASRSMGKDGIRVRVVGSVADPIYCTLRGFLRQLGHLAPDAMDLAVDSQRLGASASSPSVRREPRCVTVHIIDSFARRDAMFGPGRPSLDNRFSLFVWSGSAEKAGAMPFTDDAIGQRLMRYLVLVADWEKYGLAESLFSAIGTRCVDILHDKPSRAEFVSPSLSIGAAPRLGALGGGSTGAGAGGVPSSFNSAIGTYVPPAKVHAVREEEEGPATVTVQA